MFAGGRLLVALLALSSVHAGDDDDEQEAAALEAGFLSAAETEDLLINFAALRKKHGDISTLFSAFNRFKDESKQGEQALGYQEVRALLKDLGLGNMAVRHEMANLATKVTDSSASQTRMGIRPTSSSRAPQELSPKISHIPGVCSEEVVDLLWIVAEDHGHER